VLAPLRQEFREAVHLTRTIIGHVQSYGKYKLLAHTIIAHTIIAHTIIAHTIIEHTIIEHTIIAHTIIARVQYSP
jgi:hypothetical protein